MAKPSAIDHEDRDPVALKNDICYCVHETRSREKKKKSRNQKNKNISQIK